MTAHRDVWSLALAIVLLVGIAAGVGSGAHLGQARAVLMATFRAVLQLIAVGTVVVVVFRTPALAPLYLAVMLGAAAWTSGHRLRLARHGIRRAGTAVLAGAGASAIVVFGSGALPADVRSFLPFTAQMIGGAMTATTLAGQRMIDDVDAGWDQVEGWLAIGAPPRQAVREPARRAAARSLVPALDQTRNVGLVVLPGAYVGLLLGGASPVDAGRLQLLVLVGLLAAETVAAVLITFLVGRDLALTRPSAPRPDH